jgi:hypothetical protein
MTFLKSDSGDALSNYANREALMQFALENFKIEMVIHCKIGKPSWHIPAAKTILT